MRITRSEVIDVLRKWRDEHAWVAVVFEDNLALCRCGGHIDEVVDSSMTMYDKKSQFTFTLINSAEFEWNDERRKSSNGSQIDSVLTIRLGEYFCTLYAFGEEPEQFPML